MQNYYICILLPESIGTFLPENSKTNPNTMKKSALWSRDRECYSEVRFMPEKDVDVVLDACGECGIHPFVYTLGADGVLEVYHAAYALNHAERSFYEQRRSLPLKHFHLGTGLPAAARGRTILFCALGPTTLPEQTPAPASETPADSSLSESLARIFIGQGRYSRALEIISDLAERNPEKNPFYAEVGAARRQGGRRSRAQG